MKLLFEQPLIDLIYKTKRSLYKMSMKKTLLLSAISFAAFAQIASAGEVHVKNENKKELEIKIEAEGDSNAHAARTISAEQESKFEITAAELNGKMYYSVKGGVNAFTPSSTCDHLHVDKNYQLTFQDDKVGTTCMAVELDAEGKVAVPAKM